MTKQFYLFPSLLVLTCISLLFIHNPSKDSKPALADKPQGRFAILELFTSQGCSSCPPADRLLAKYALKNDPSIIPLAFHVDYWNRLGWKDSFSSALYSERQREYSSLIPGSSTYTPQLVVNGTTEFVGSDEAKVKSAVDRALTIDGGVTVSIKKLLKKADTVSLQCEVSMPQKNYVLLTALVQHKITTHILKGENTGVTLDNYNVVRDFKKSDLLKQTGLINLIMPHGYEAKDFFIVAYVQDKNSGKIIAAVTQDINIGK